MIPYCRLPLTFDVARMQSDLGGILPSDWTAHFNRGYFEGNWSGVPFRSVGGSATHIYPDPSQVVEWKETPFLARCPYLREVLATFRCQQKAVRLLRLGASSQVREHRDHELSFEDGEIRIHIPIVTNPQVEFVLAGERLMLGEGESWYINFNLPHRVANRGATDRVHLVIDCVVNDWLRDMIRPIITPSVSAPTPPPLLAPSETTFEQFCEHVLRDEALQARLRDIVDRQAFIEVAVQLGQERGFAFTAADVRGAIQAARKSWLERAVTSA